MFLVHGLEMYRGSENLFQVYYCWNIYCTLIYALSSYVCTITSMMMSTIKCVELTEDCKRFISYSISLEQ